MTCPRKIGPYGELDFVMDEETEAAIKKKTNFLIHRRFRVAAQEYGQPSHADSEDGRHLPHGFPFPFQLLSMRVILVGLSPPQL